MFRLVCTALVAVMMTASLALAAPVTLKLGHIADPQNPYAQGAERFAAMVKERTNGEVDIQVFPSSQLGNQRDLVEGLTFGTVDMTLSSTAVLGNFIPEMGVFDLPFLFRDIEHAYHALDTVGMEIAKTGEARGIKTLAMMENGIRHMTNSRQPIRVPADMKGLKVRVMEQPIYISMMKEMDASPTPMAFGEIYTALQKGVIDAQENPLAHIWTSRFFEVQKYVSLTAHTYSAEPLLVSTIAWNRLSPEHQQIIEQAALEATVWQRDLCRSLEDKFIEDINASGISTVNSDVDLAAFAQATKPTWDIFIKKHKNGQEIVDSIVNTK